MTRRGKLLTKMTVLVAAVLAATMIAACGGSGWSSAQKAKLKQELSSSINSELSGHKLDSAVKTGLGKLEDCITANIEKHYSPGSDPTDSAMNKTLDSKCASAFKNVEKRVEAERKK